MNNEPETESRRDGNIGCGGDSRDRRGGDIGNGDSTRNTDRASFLAAFTNQRSEYYIFDEILRILRQVISNDDPKSEYDKQIEKNDRINSYKEEVQKIQLDRIFENTRRSAGRYITHVYRFNSLKEIYSAASCIRKFKSTTRSFLLFCIDEFTIQTAHDCSFSNGTCRCSWRRQLDVLTGVDGKPHHKGHSPNINKIDRAGLETIIAYYSTRGRVILNSSSGGQLEAIPSRNKVMGYDAVDRNLEAGCLAGNMQEVFVSVFGEGYAVLPTLSRTARINKEKVSKRARSIMDSDKEIEMQTIVNLLKETPIYPPEAICSSIKWLDSDILKFKNESHNCVRDALQAYRSMLCHWELSDFWNNIYSKPDRDWETT
jgi:hypothetical protein